MMNKGKKTELLMEKYREESPKLAIIIMIVSVVLIGAPLTMANKRIGDEGQRAADVSKYAQLAQQLNAKMALVLSNFKRGVVNEDRLRESDTIGSRGPTLITPHITPTNVSEDDDPNKLDIKLSAIYWNEKDPLVTIDNENYRVGDKVNGFTILEISKTSIIPRNPAGEIVTKNF